MLFILIMDKQPTIKLRVSIQLYDSSRQQYVPTRNLRFNVDPAAGSPGLIAAVAETLTEVVAQARTSWSDL